MPPRQMAHDVWEAISTNNNTRQTYINKLVALILTATTSSDAVRLIEVLDLCENVDKHFIENLYDNYSTNSILNVPEVVDSINPIFQKYGLNNIAISLPKAARDDDEILPF